MLFFAYTQFVTLLKEDRFGYEDGPPDYSDFCEEYQNCLEILEDNFRYDHVQFNSEEFWDAISEPFASKIYETFNEEIEAKTEELYQKEYVKGFDKELDTEIYTETYHVLRKEAIQRSKTRKNGLTPHYMKEILYTNLYLNPKLAKEEFWPIYEKAVRELHKFRGKLKGKKFGF